MDLIPQAAEHQNVLENVSKFTQAVRQLLTGSDIDAESQLKVQDLLSLLETSTAEAMKEVEQLLASAEHTANRLRSTMAAEHAPKSIESIPQVPTPAAELPTDAQLGYRLGFDLLRNFGYLPAAAAANPKEYRTILDWVHESMSLVANPQSPPPPGSPGTHATTPANDSVPIAPISSKPSAHIDLGWTTWLASTHAHEEIRHEEKQPEAPEDLWRDLFT